MTNSAGSSLNIRKQISKIHDTISTSYHEAGHALYSLLHGMKVYSVTISQNKKNKRIQGVCFYEIPEISLITDPVLFYKIASTEVGIKYAGLISEKYFYKTISGSNKFPISLKEGSSDDTLSATAIIKKYNIVEPGKERYKFKKKIINKVSKDLTDNWQDVILLAHSIFEKKKITYLDICKILTTKSNNKKFWKQKFKNIDAIFNNLESLDEQELKIIMYA